LYSLRSALVSNSNYLTTDFKFLPALLLSAQCISVVIYICLKWCIISGEVIFGLMER